MSISASLITELTNLQAQLKAAEPLQAASQPTLVALQLNTAHLLSDAVAAMNSAAGQLDTWVAPTDPSLIISGVVGLTTNATDQENLSNWVGYIGRANKNIDQLVP